MILRIRDANGKVQEILVIKGDKGEDGKDYVLTLVDKMEIANMVNVDIDQTYNAESENSQSGKAVAEALLTISQGSETQKQYELINTITVVPDTDGSLPQYVNFTLDKDGKPFELTDFFVKAYAGFTDGNKSTLYMKVNDVAVIANNIISSISSNTNRTFMIYYRRENDGFIRMEVSNSIQGNSYYNAQTVNDVSRLLPLQFYPQLSETVNNISIYTLLGDNKTWIDGSTFELYGVRK